MAQEQGTSGDEQLRATEIVSEPMVDQVPVAVDDAQDELHGTDEPVRMDYSHSTRQELANIIRELAQETDQRRVDSTLREIKPVWDDLQERERSNALQRFLESGGTKEDFSYKADELDNLFDGTFKLLRDRRARNLKEQDEQRQRNLIRKQELLEQLRTLVDSEDNASSMKAFKEIQAGWKKAGAVPANFNKDLWASYHALVDRFYDQRSILFELKELDRRKNLEAKQELVMRAEKLMASERINDAVKELNELHNEFRHIGPVPKEEQEALWLQFKKASDAVYEKRDAFVKELTINLHKNLEQKNTLLATIEPFATYQTDRIKEWNEKTREILALQKQWESSGGVPRSKSKEVNKRFWSAFKSFFHNKSTFFHKLDGERQANLQLKQALVETAKNLKDNADWEKTAQEMKTLQSKWKDIGPVPEKQRDKIFAEFKEACDHFFNRRRTQQDQEDQEQQQNLLQKEALCTELEQQIASGTATANDVASYNERFQSIGFVPRQAVNVVRNRFNAAIEKLIRAESALSEEDKDKALLQFELSSLKDSPDAGRKLQQREQNLRRKIQQVENDLAVLKNNLEFFGRSKNAEKLKAEFNEKIEAHARELSQLKSQLKLLRQAF